MSFHCHFPAMPTQLWQTLEMRNFMPVVTRELQPVQEHQARAFCLSSLTAREVTAMNAPRSDQTGSVP